MALAYISVGDSLYQAGKYKEAVEKYNQAIKLDPNNFTANNKKGLALTSSGNYKEAVKCFNKVIALNPESSEAYCNKGQALRDVQSYQEAIECYDKAISLNPNDAQVHYDKAISFFLLSNDEEAIECLKKANQVKPDYTDSIFFKGSLLYNLGKYQEALEDFEQVISLNSEYKNIHNYMGRSLARLKRYEEAVEHFKQEINTYPDEALFYCYLANALLNIGRNKEAFEAFGKAEEVIGEKAQTETLEYRIPAIRTILKQIVRFEMIAQKSEDLLEHLNSEGTVAAENFKGCLEKIQKRKIKIFIDINMDDIIGTYNKRKFTELKQDLAFDIAHIQAETAEIKLEIEQILAELRKSDEEFKPRQSPDSANSNNTSNKQSCCNLF